MPWSLPDDEVHRWSNGPNWASVKLLTPRVIVFEIAGTVGAEALELIEPKLAHFLEHGPGRGHMFWDTDRLERHDGVLRDKLLALMRAHRAKWDFVHVLVSSPLVAVTVSAAALFLGGSVKTYRRRVDFHAVLERELASR